MARTRRAPTSDAVRRTTIKDVALAAGVSITTVSNVLNGHVDAMAEDTLARIQATITALNFRPNGLARGLVNRRTATIGLVIAEIETPLFIQSLTFIERMARNVGYNVLVCNARNLEDEQNAIKLLLEKEVEGFIFLSTSVYLDDHHLRALQDSGRAVVLINRLINTTDVDQITWDNAGGVASAVTHLVRLGHRHIAHLHGPQDRRSSAERLRGYRQGLEQHGIAVRPGYLKPGDYTAGTETWQRSTQELLALSRPPTAIIAADDVVAAVVIKTIQRAGLRVPEDVAVIGIDDQPFASYLNPALTTVRLPVIEAATQATDILLSRIAGTRPKAWQIVLPCPLVIRESCGAASGAADGALL